MGGRFVAIRCCRSSKITTARRFEREADIAGTLDHRNIVQIFDRDEHDRRPFIVMEYVDGATLAVIVSMGGVPLSRKLQWMQELCDGLSCAHGAGVVHRDIKPSNLMVRKQDGILKILDFGIARANAWSKTMTQGIVGTFNYMAPEQWEPNGSVAPPTDVFAAGAVFYELLCGHKAFPGHDIPAIFRQITNQAPEALENRLPGLEPDLIAVVNRCLEKEPGNRYQELDTVRTRLEHIRLRVAAREADRTSVMPVRSIIAEAGRAFEQGDFPRVVDLSDMAAGRSR